jgi:excisionase family DNA binding protein
LARLCFDRRGARQGRRDRGGRGRARAFTVQAAKTGGLTGMDKKSYRLDEVAEQWDVSRKTVQRLIQKGELEAFKIGSHWRIRRENLDEFEKKNGPLKTL